MTKVIQLVEVAPKAPKPRSFWSDWRRGGERILWCEAPDGGYWWSSLVLIERMGKPPKEGQVSARVLKLVEDNRAKGTLPVPDRYQYEPPQFKGEAGQNNYGKVGKYTLLLNARYVDHLSRKGYRLAQVAGDSPAKPVLFYKGDLLMGLVLPIIPPEYEWPKMGRNATVERHFPAPGIYLDRRPRVIKAGE